MKQKLFFPCHSVLFARLSLHFTRHTSFVSWHAVIDAVKIMKLSTQTADEGGGAAAAPASSPQHDVGVVLLPPRIEAVAAAPVSGDDDFVGIGLSIAPDMTVIFLHPFSCNLLLIRDMLADSKCDSWRCCVG
jgi:hypothetical protein